MRADEGVVRLLNEAYLMMTDRGPQGPADPRRAMAFLLVGLEKLAEMDHGARFLTLGRLEPRALVWVASQAVTELAHLGWHP